MKLVNDMAGTPIDPDYEALRAALVAAQATTPTARAANATTPAARRSRDDRAAALHDLLTIAAAAADDAVALGNSFASSVPPRKDTP